MRIWFGSDLHADFWGPGEKVTRFFDDIYDLYIFAGDLSEWNLGHSRKQILEPMAGLPVLWIPGNHEYYSGEYFNVTDEIIGTEGALVDSFVDFPEQKLRVFGSTLWTDFGDDQENRDVAERYMNDYRHIMFQRSTGGPYLKATDLVERHYIARRELVKAYRTMPEGYKLLVVTHHAPSFKSVGKRFLKPSYSRYAKLNNAYANHLETWLEQEGIYPAAWIHGHIHDAVNYEMQIGDHRCLVVSNPFGYPRENPGIEFAFGRKYLDYSNGDFQLCS